MDVDVALNGLAELSCSLADCCAIDLVGEEGTS